MDYLECFGQYDGSAYCESCPYAYECEQGTEESIIYESLGGALITTNEKFTY